MPSQPRPATGADASWRRPPDGEPGNRPVGNRPVGDQVPDRPVGGAHPGYAGPPPRQAVPRHPVIVPAFAVPAPPRTLPEQDHAQLDAEEARATTVTYAVGIIGAALTLLLLITLLVSCSVRG
jgi:hypothetical protein